MNLYIHLASPSLFTEPPRCRYPSSRCTIISPPPLHYTSTRKLSISLFHVITQQHLNILPIPPSNRTKIYNSFVGFTHSFHTCFKSIILLKKDHPKKCGGWWKKEQNERGWCRLCLFFISIFFLCAKMDFYYVSPLLLPHPSPLSTLKHVSVSNYTPSHGTSPLSNNKILFLSFGVFRWNWWDLFFPVVSNS